MNDPIEQRVKTLELKVEFLENWKNTPFIQVTLPVILSIFLATSWNNFGFTSIDKRFDSVEKGMNKLSYRIGKVENRLGKVENRLGKVEDRLDKVENRLGKVEVKIERLN